MSIEKFSIPELIFWIPGKVTPKARARVTRNGVYFPHTYQAWRLIAYFEILNQVQLMPGIAKYLPIKKAEVHVLLFKQRSGDSDNLVGSVFDLLVKTKVVLDDRVNCIPKHSFEAVAGKVMGVKIRIVPLH